ncbi:MAG: hypothetical protein KJO75_17585 [Dactylosporangium sp.]|nr:hypothetical protein [Dactylosporangium sp.]
MACCHSASSWPARLAGSAGRLGWPASARIRQRSTREWSRPRLAAARRSDHPPLSDRVVDQREQPGLDLGVHAGTDQAGGQPQDNIPWCGCIATACSVTIARSRSISLLASARATASAGAPRGPGTRAALPTPR